MCYLKVRPYKEIGADVRLMKLVILKWFTEYQKVFGKCDYAKLSCQMKYKCI